VDAQHGRAAQPEEAVPEHARPLALRAGQEGIGEERDGVSQPLVGGPLRVDDEGQPDHRDAHGDQQGQPEPQGPSPGVPGDVAQADVPFLAVALVESVEGVVGIGAGVGEHLLRGQIQDVVPLPVGPLLVDGVGAHQDVAEMVHEPVPRDVAGRQRGRADDGQLAAREGQSAAEPPQQQIDQQDEEDQPAEDAEGDVTADQIALLDDEVVEIRDRAHGGPCQQPDQHGAKCQGGFSGLRRPRSADAKGPPSLYARRRDRRNNARSLWLPWAGNGMVRDFPDSLVPMAVLHLQIL